MGFVPYDIEKDRPHCFEVHRSGDRCVCGCSAVVTSREYPDRGYCTKCSEKRENFVNEIIGNIDLAQDELTNMVLEPLEQMRKFMLRDRLYFIIDSHFSVHDRYRGDFVEPYENTTFQVHCICEKCVATEHLLNSICASEYVRGSRINKAVRNAQLGYISQLREMLEFDLDNKNALCAEHYGYSYTRKHPKL